jgi:hypothetical protein
MSKFAIDLPINMAGLVSGGFHPKSAKHPRMPKHGREVEDGVTSLLEAAQVLASASSKSEQARDLCLHFCPTFLVFCIRD